MIGYVMLGSNNMEKAAAYYDTLLAELGAKRFMEFDSCIIWGTTPDKPMLSITRPYDGNPATVGNGVMVALNVQSTAEVDRIYNKAIELGSKDEGPAGPRSEGFYAGYFRDLEGNKLCACCYTV